jgi:uncharacterized protein (DUF2384 family)
VRLQALALQVFGDADKAAARLRQPKQRLAGVALLEFATDAAGLTAIEDWLHEIEHGYFS